MHTAAFFSPSIHIPEDFNTNFLMAVRWIHFLAGVTWLGLLYFFNLVNVPFMKELDASTRGKVMPSLMTRALWWFRMSAALTVLPAAGRRSLQSALPALRHLTSAIDALADDAHPGSVTGTTGAGETTTTADG